MSCFSQLAVPDVGVKGTNPWSFCTSEYVTKDFVKQSQQSQAMHYTKA